MEATFFACPRADAMGVSSVDDLPCEPAGDAICVQSIAALSGLARVLCPGAETRVEPLRDATCRSFPVFEIPDGVRRALAGLSEDRIDSVAEQWIEEPGVRGADVDLFEMASLLSDLRQALMQADPGESGLFVLLEEKAF